MTDAATGEGLEVHEDFEYLMSFLPADWRAKAKDLGALRRCRKMPDAATLLRVLLIHLAEGCSLRETAVRARQGRLVELSDVAILDRLRQSGEWFRWMNVELMRRWVARQPESVLGSRWPIRLVDSTRIKEPGPTGSSWSVHYSIRLPSLACAELQVGDPHEAGESFCRFTVQPGELFLGDRVYGVRPGIFHVLGAGGHVLTRFAMSNLPLQTPAGARFDLLRRLRQLSGTRIGDWPVRLEWKGQEARGRVCAIKKSRGAAEKARRDVIRGTQKDGSTTRPETLEAAGYVFVLCTLEADQLGATGALEMYRGRWQIELVFKRLKSIIELGHLRKTDPDAAKAWIHGKLFVSFLVELLVRHAESFFPWGYPIDPAAPSPLSVAGVPDDAPPRASGHQPPASLEGSGAELV
ncbi:MAG: transposase [Bryobacteraceae bacterium]